MKQLLFLLVLIIPMFSIAQTDGDVDSAAIKTAAIAKATPLTGREVYEDAKSGFTKLVNTLKGPAKHTYEVYVKQYFYSAVGFLILTLFFLIGGFITWKRAYPNADFGDGNGYAVASIIGIVVNVTGLILLIVFFTNYFADLVNPEFSAIEKIIQTIK